MSAEALPEARHHVGYISVLLEELPRHVHVPVLAEKGDVLRQLLNGERRQGVFPLAEERLAEEHLAATRTLV